MGIGTTSPSYDAKVHIIGSGLRIDGNQARFRIQMNGVNNSPTALGVANGKLAFWYSGVGYNRVFAQSYEPSDSTIKTNIRTFNNGLDLLMDLKPYTYYLKSDVKLGNPKLTYGFISQQAEKVMPDITEESMDVLCMDYTQIIPVLVSGVQTQQNNISEIDSLVNAQEDKIEELLSRIESLEEQVGSEESQNTVEVMESKAILFQNKPNPFKERTFIEYKLPEEFKSAQLMIFDMTGVLLETYDLSRNTSNVLEFEAKHFKPGMYLYSLIVDGSEVDSKRMILQK